MGLYSGGLIIRKIFAYEIWGAYFQEGLFYGGAYQNFMVSAFQQFCDGFDGVIIFSMTLIERMYCMASVNFYNERKRLAVFT